MAEHGAVHALEHAQAQLCEMIELGESRMSLAALRLRERFFTLLHNLPIVCRALLHKAKEHDAFEYVLFYERVRLGKASPHYFLDSVPLRVQLFVGHTNDPSANVAKLKVADVVADRIKTVGTMEQLAGGSPCKNALLKAHSAPLSANVPGPVRFLVARTRAVLQALRSTKRVELFSNCANCNCRRLMYVGEPVESWAGAALATSFCGEADEPMNSGAYWEAVLDTFASAPDTRRFCSRSCAVEHSAHLARLMPDFGLQMDADDCASRCGRPRVSEAFRMALKRNEVAARCMRTLRTQSLTGSAVSSVELKRSRKRIIKALNVDLGLLYAASIIAESNSLSHAGKLLPGQSMYWRDDPAFYAKALISVKKLYESTFSRDVVISTMLHHPRFMELLSARAYKIF